MRLDKYLADMGIGTRSQVKEAIRKGKVSINGQVMKSSDSKIDLEQTEVIYEGQKISYVSYEYYMLNKPAGVVSAVSDNRYRTVVDLIDTKARKDLFPVGRLDIDTEGLLIITNDGPLTHNLLAPKKHVDKVYFVKVDADIPSDTKARFEEGITLEDGTKTKPANLECINKREAKLTIHEGKFHQVKRMFEAVGVQVIYLKRLSMGPVSLDETLKLGEFRPLTKDEIERLKGVL